MDFNAKDQFHRTALLIGRENIEKLKNRRVAVFGVGGVGGHAVEALCRAGVGKIDVFDGDAVDVTNINRQLIATHKTIGCDKVDVMKKRMLEINPDVIIGAVKMFYLPETADDVDLSVYDYIIDAVDTMTAKIELVCRAKKLDIPIICSMGAANKLDPTAFEVADIYKTTVCPMARIMRKELRIRGVEALRVVYSKEIPCIKNHPPFVDGTLFSKRAKKRPLPSSISFVPPVVGLILAGEVIMDLIS